MSVCIYCGEALRNTEEDNDHWESCADHPARKKVAELEAQINKMKSCNNCNHHHGEECTDPDLSELTHEEYYNGCEHWSPRDAA